MDGDGVPVVLPRWEGDDVVRLDEGRSGVQSTSAGASWDDVGVRPEWLRTPARSEVDVADGLLREKWGKRGEKMRTVEGYLTDQDWAARTH